MTRSTAPWITSLAAAAVLALPLGTLAQTPAPNPQQTPPPAEQPQQAPQPAPAPTEQPKQAPQPAPAPTEQPTQAPQPAPPPTEPPQPTPPATEQPSATPMPQASPQDHLRQAKAALADIQDTTLTDTARTRLAELRRHMTALERAAAAPAQATAPSRSQRRTGTGPQNWATEVAAIDRVITQMIGTGAATGAGTPPATTGTTGTAGTKAQAAIAVDEAARGKLMEVRTHITAFAAAMSGTHTQPSTSTTEPAAPPPSGATPTPGQTRPIADPDAPPTHSPATPAQTQPTAQTPAQPSTAQTPAPPSTTPTGNADAEASKRHLTAARDTLTQLTQLPEAAQLTGDARTQVTQLIANFNELITTQAEWRASFAKLDANLTSLIGAERTDEPDVAPPATGIPGAIGTSGMATLDPKIREKLVEFRRHLAEFQRAAGGVGPAR
jgi:hypothetical protein